MECVPELVVQEQLGTRNTVGNLFGHPYRRKNVFFTPYDQRRNIDLAQIRQCIVVDASRGLPFQPMQRLRKRVKCINPPTILQILMLFRIVPRRF